MYLKFIIMDFFIPPGSDIRCLYTLMYFNLYILNIFTKAAAFFSIFRIGDTAGRTV